MDEGKLKVARGNCQRKFDDICAAILDSQASLTALMVKAVRAGMEPKHGLKAFTEITACVSQAVETYQAAIAQPEAKISAKRRIEF